MNPATVPNPAQLTSMSSRSARRTRSSTARSFKAGWSGLRRSFRLRRRSTAAVRRPTSSRPLPRDDDQVVSLRREPLRILEPDPLTTRRSPLPTAARSVPSVFLTHPPYLSSLSAHLRVHRLSQPPSTRQSTATTRPAVRAHQHEPLLNPITGSLLAASFRNRIAASEVNNMQARCRRGGPRPAGIIAPAVPPTTLPSSMSTVCSLICLPR